MTRVVQPGLVALLLSWKREWRLQRRLARKGFRRSERQPPLRAWEVYRRFRRAGQMIEVAA